MTQVYSALQRAYGPQRWWPAETGFEMALGAILTQNTAWSNVEKAVANLKAEGLLEPGPLARAHISKVRSCVRPAGYYRQKAERIRRFARWLISEHQGEVAVLLGLGKEKARAELLSFNGIGPETADSILLYAGGYPAFVIDAYTRRLANRYPLSKERGYAELQSFFQAGLPADSELFNEYHALIVKHAKEHCRARPECGGCPLAKGCESRH